MTRLSGVILLCCTSGTASSNRREAALPHCALSHAHAVSPDGIARPGTTVGTSIVLRRSLESALSRPPDIAACDAGAGLLAGPSITRSELAG